MGWRRGKEGREEGRGSCTSSRRSSRGRRRRRQEEKEEEEGCQVNGINLIDFFLYFSNPHTNTDANTVYNNVRKGCSTKITDEDRHHSSELIFEQKIDYMKLRCSLLLSTRLFYLFVFFFFFCHFHKDNLRHLS